MPDLVKITIDGVEIHVPKGTNLIDAAASAGIEIPHYCYHPDLSIAGNCRMCQVAIEGSPKLTIACNTGATEGMIVKTHHSSPDVAEAQRATLEFILINHPLDCTVCDQAGHCKLQDYYYEYNAQASRFVDSKVHKVKAEPLGPEVMYDGERCILCTRCVRFCDEIPETAELSVLNRGDHSLIAINPDHPLDNPFSGTVVDLCPVGALTHKRWRFNTRIWYTDAQDSICTGCSTGCNVRAYMRDGRIVQIKARMNSQVNKEWLCDEGRYGFERFQPELGIPTKRLEGALVRAPEAPNGYRSVPLSDALQAAAAIAGEGAGNTTAVFLSPRLTLEEIWLSTEFAKRVLSISADSGQIAVQCKRRALSEVEAKLISPDYAPNARGGLLLGIGKQGGDWREGLERGYAALLERVRRGEVKRLMLVGDGAIDDSDLDAALEKAIGECEVSVALTPRGVEALGAPAQETGVRPVQVGSNGHPTAKAQKLGAHAFCRVVLPGRTVNEKHGVMVNASNRLQRLKQLLPGSFNSQPEWMLLARLAEACGRPLIPTSVTDDRAMFREMVSKVPQLSGLTLMKIGELGVSLDEGGHKGSKDAGAAAQV